MKSRRSHLRSAACAALLLSALLGPRALHAQGQGEARRPVGPTRDSTVFRPASPGGAFLRSMLLPGWGQAAVGAYGRGGFYFATEAAVGWMLFKTGRRRRAARDLVGLEEAEAEAFFIAQGIMDPDSLASRVDEDERVMEARELEETRSQQFEDWFAFGVFMLFLNGADAFVASHLADFPEALTTELRTYPTGEIELTVGLVPPWDRPRR